MIGKSILHYRIIEKLGEGGMGVVYLAEDTKLKRQVAIKFLPRQSMANPEESKRFEIEAQTASALDHPNIGTIFEINEDDGQPFIAMAHYKGNTLRHKIQQGPMDIEEALKIAIQTASGLAKAHSKNIIHRDVKPANIIITEDDQVKIIDFGLAKLSGQSILTKTGSTIGTISYMSPEQTQGAAVDHRTDVWALGVILYEMLSGERVFKGDYEQAVMYAILNEDPEYITKVRPDVPVEIENIINKALAKQPDKRFKSMDEMQEALQQILDEIRLGKSTTASVFKLNRRQQKIAKRFLPVVAVAFLATLIYLWFGNQGQNGPVSIALVPFENISRDSEQEWFSDGMTDALITNLARIAGLKIISRSSVMKYKKSDKTTAEIADELGVSYIIEGSVIKIEDQVKISARLIDSSSDEYLWAHDYNRDLKDVLSLQSELAQAIVGQVKVKLTPFEQTLLNQEHTVKPEAYEAYLKGNFYWYKQRPEDLKTAIKYFERAVELDPKYAQAYAGIALSYSVAAQYGYEPVEVVSKKVEPAFNKALELDSTIAEVHYMRALIHAWIEWDWEEAVESFEKAIKLNPNMAEARAYYAHVLFYLNKPQQAMQHIEQALELDPFNTLYHGLYGMCLMYAHQYDDVINMLLNSMETSPRDPMTLSTLISAYHQKKMYEKAMEMWRKTYEAKNDKEALEALNKGYKEGGYTVALKNVAQLFEKRSKTSYVTPWQIATLYTRAGIHNEALDYLEKAYDSHDPNMPYISVDPIFDDLRDETRFKNLLNKMNLAHNEPK